MKIAKVIVEFDLSEGESAVREFQDFLHAYLNRGAKPTGSEVSTPDSCRQTVDPDQINRLRRLSEGLTQKQLQVWRVFMENPGPISATKLKNLLPELKQPGALPGVFRAAHRWVTQLGGEKSDCPFTQIRWTGSEGIYRGLTPEEVEALRQEPT
ncbi:MAG TPA: hypothetical protein VIL07_02260 [Symbiobacteriaceae bacterium]